MFCLVYCVLYTHQSSSLMQPFNIYFVMLVISLSTASTKLGKLESVRQSLMKSPSCVSGKFVSTYAFPRTVPFELIA